MNQNTSDNNFLSQEKIVENFGCFESLCSKLGERKNAIESMLLELGQRLATAPASTRADFHGAYPGGLIDHSLRVARYALKIKKSIDLFSSLTDESIIFSALFHDLGKVGEPGANGNDYYIPEASDWHRQKLGQYYKCNSEVICKNVEGTLLILLHYGIVPTRDELLAIKLNDGQYTQSNHEYAMHEPKLALLIHTADRWACEEEKDAFQIKL